MRYLYLAFLFCSLGLFGQSQGVTNSQTKLRPNQLRWSPTDATLDSVYIIRADTSTGEPGWYLVTLGGGGGGVADTTLAGDVVGGLNSTFVRKINGVTVENKTPQAKEVLQYNGTQWTPDSIDLADLPTLAQSVLLGRGSASTGVPQAISLGTGLSMSGTTLSNSAPDQTVTISGATGTYPNFTVTPTSPAGSSMQVQYNNAGSFGALDSFTVFANPDRVGIGVPVPTARLDIQGSGSTSATNALRVRNSSGTDLIIVDNSANVGLGTSNRLNGLSAINYLDIGTFASTPGGINVMGYSSLGGTSSGGWGAVGSNYFLNSANVLKRRFADPVSILTFESGGFQFKNAGSAAINSTIALTQLASINSGGFFALNVTTALAGFHNNVNTTESTPSMLLSGTGFSGGTATTTKPTLLIEPTGTKSTGWSTLGTKLGVNAETGFTGNLLDLQLNGVSKVSADANGNLNFSGRLYGGSWRTPSYYDFYQPILLTGATSGYYFNSLALTGANTTQNFWQITTTINKTGTGSYTLIDADVTETSTPSGTNYLMNLKTGGSSKFSITNGGKITSASDKINLATSKTPSSATDTGTTGDIAWDSNYIYVCVATNTWKRTAISTW